MSRNMREILEQPRRFLVAGDIMLDRYITGRVKRISPEAPVPVLEVSGKSHTPGGAGNVAVNLAGLNGKVTLIGYTGNDSSREKLSELFASKGIVMNPVDWDRGTISKTRVMASRQQIVRIDEEEKGELSHDEKRRMGEFLERMDLDDFEGILISDYDKRTCSPELCSHLIGKGREKGLPVIVDPKGTDWEKYRGATAITPNLKELGDVLGRDIPNEDVAVGVAISQVREMFSIDNIIVTRSEKGMSLVWEDEVLHIPTQAREVFDVSGAGDTVAACLLRFLSDGLSVPDAVSWANRAAGAVVAFVGTHPITVELLLAGEGEAVPQSWEKVRKYGKKVVFTNGCFDLLHPGHLDYLKKARLMGDFLIVGLNSDNSVRRLKGESRPVNGEESRKLMLEALSFVDQVVLFDEDTPEELIKSIRPDILVKGGDYRIDQIAGREYAGETLVIPFLEGFSSTDLIQRIQSLHG